MGKKKRPPKLKSDPGSVQFELNEDDAALFREYVESEIPAIQDAEQPDDQPRVHSRRQKHESMIEIDLHGLTVVEAKALVNETLRRLLAKHARFAVRVITGKGLHSGPSGAVLPGEIYGHIQSQYGQYIEKIDESPNDVRLHSLPLRGHFCVWFRSK